MASCKDCINYELCKSLTDFTEEFIESCEKNFDKYGDAKEKCEHFKDRSKIVELPCKVGDVVYAVSKCNNKIFSKIVVEILLKEDNGYIYTEPCYFIFEDFGKTVFLTKEEAEKALAERSGKE